jgi:hypothetical protein
MLLMAIFESSCPSPIRACHTDHAFKQLHNSFPQGFPEMMIIPITEGKMVLAIISLNNKNLPSFD